jgi:hypothetical protein
VSINDVTPEKLAKILERVRLMMARADHPNTPVAEADLCRERAERLIAQYRIEEASLGAEDKARMGIKPTAAWWDVCPLGSEFSMAYRAMASYVLNHVGAVGAVSKYETITAEDGTQTTWLRYKVYGFASDLAYGDILWQSIKIGFAGKLEPRYDPSLSDEENVYRMRSAGMERNRIGQAMGWGWEGKAPAKVTRTFKKACEARGESASVLTGKGNNVKTFRRSYADGFASEMFHRLYRLRSATGQNTTSLVMANRDEVIREAMYQDYPNLRPVPVGGVAAANGKAIRRARKQPERPTNWAAMERGRSAAGTVDLGPAGARSVTG